MEQKKVLVTYFEKFGGRPNNFSKFIGEFLVEKLQCDYIELEVKRFGVKNIQSLKDSIHEKQPDIIISLGEETYGKYDLQIERIFVEDNHNFIKNTNFKKLIINTKYHNKCITDKSSPCIQTRNFLFDFANNYDYVWEFLHINRNCTSIKNVVDYIYDEIVSLLPK